MGGMGRVHFPLIPKNDLLHRVKPAVCSLLPREANCVQLGKTTETPPVIVR